MKKKSVEAKAYDKALSIAKNIYGASESKDILCTLETIFPELRESVDERIRKKLIDLIYKVYANTSYITCIEHENMLAWLEKQGENAKFRNKIRIGDKVTRNKDGVLVNLSQLNRVAKKDEQKPTDKVEPKFKIGDYVKNVNDKREPIYEIVYMDKECYICEYRGKERMGDKAVMHFAFDNPYLRLVEPKFKVGDWIVSNVSHEDYRICKILNIENGEYAIESIYGYQGHNNFEIFDKAYHLWNINEAKDGDVLFIGIDGSTCIFKKLEGDLLYSYIISDGKLLVEDSHYYYETSDNVYPATKEQRDLLFQKMKEAGYEWLEETKELKKIE